MADTTPQRRVLPPRQRRESVAKKRAISPPSKPATPAAKAPVAPTTSEDRPKRKYEKRIKTVHVSTPARSASTPVSNTDEVLPTRITSTRPLPTSKDKQSDNLPSAQYQSIADSAILAASLHRSRMQWLYDGVFKKYWTKPIKRKKVIEEPPNNPDVKSMQKLGNATVTIEPHTFDATFYVVKDPQAPNAPIYSHSKPLPSKQNVYSGGPTSSTIQPSVHAPVVSKVRVAPAPGSKASSISTTPALDTTTAGPASVRPATPPGGAKVNDPVIQMLASRAATDNNLKELMKVVATSRATPDQLREFQAHIDEFNTIVKKQEAEKEAKGKTPVLAPTPIPSPHPSAAAVYPTAHSTIQHNSPLNPTSASSPHFASYPVQARPEPAIKHVVMEFTSIPCSGQSANSDRWLFPEYAVLDTQYGGTEMTCSFFIMRKGADILASMKDLTTEEMQGMSNKWKATTEYYQPVTMTIKATQHRIIETIARSARSLPEVQKYMQEVMEEKTRAPQEHLVHRLLKEKTNTSVAFVDSAVELSGEDDELKDSYPI